MRLSINRMSLCRKIQRMTSLMSRGYIHNNDPDSQALSKDQPQGRQARWQNAINTGTHLQLFPISRRIACTPRPQVKCYCWGGWGSFQELVRNCCMYNRVCHLAQFMQHEQLGAQWRCAGTESKIVDMFFRVVNTFANSNTS